MLTAICEEIEQFSEFLGIGKREENLKSAAEKVGETEVIRNWSARHLPNQRIS